MSNHSHSAKTQTTASRFKDLGNVLFAQRHLEKAVQAYSRAIDLLHQQQVQEASDRAHHRVHDYHDDEKDLLLYAVVCSNRSACYYEMENFDRAAVDANTCIDYLDDLLRMQHKFEHTLAHTPILSPADESKATSMRSANQWRRTRALLYQHDGDLTQAQARLDVLSIKDGDNKMNNGASKSSKDNAGAMPDQKQESQCSNAGGRVAGPLTAGLFPPL